MLGLQMKAAKTQQSQRCPNCKQPGIQMYCLTFPKGMSWKNAVPEHILDCRNLPQTPAVIPPCHSKSCIQAGRHRPPTLAQGPGRPPTSGNSSYLVCLKRTQISDRTECFSKYRDPLSPPRLFACECNKMVIRVIYTESVCLRVCSWMPSSPSLKHRLTAVLHGWSVGEGRCPPLALKAVQDLWSYRQGDYDAFQAFTWRGWRQAMVSVSALTT